VFRSDINAEEFAKLSRNMKMMILSISSFFHEGNLPAIGQDMMAWKVK